MKFHNRKTIVDDIKFDSRLEARRYQELTLLERAGVIQALTLQPEFELQPAFKKNGKTYRKITYRADFSYFEVETGKIIVEDTKGFKTDVYAIKKKLFEYRYPELTIREVKK